MASFEPIIRINENAFRAHEKIQPGPKVGRKPLSDMTNSRKPLAKDKSSVKNISGFKAPEKVVQPKVGRKPLGDLTNSKKPPAQEKSSKKNCIGNLSAAVNKEQVHSLALGEGFLHNHDECIKANRQSFTMSTDYFLETVALKRDSTSATTTSWLCQPLKASNLELEILMEIEEMEIGNLDLCAPLSSPTLKSPRSPSMDFKNLEFSPLKLKESLIPPVHIN